MPYSNHGRFRQQVRFLRRQFLQDGDLPFRNVLSDEIVKQALTTINVFWMDRVYSPLITLWVFLEQVLSADSCCRAAVARLIAYRLPPGQARLDPLQIGLEVLHLPVDEVREIEDARKRQHFRNEFPVRGREIPFCKRRAAEVTEDLVLRYCANRVFAVAVEDRVPS